MAFDTQVPQGFEELNESVFLEMDKEFSVESIKNDLQNELPRDSLPDLNDSDQDSLELILSNNPF